MVLNDFDDPPTVLFDLVLFHFLTQLLLFIHTSKFIDILVIKVADAVFERRDIEIPHSAPFLPGNIVHIALGRSDLVLSASNHIEVFILDMR